MSDGKPKKFSRSKSETIRTIVSIVQMVVAVATLLLVLHGQGLLG